jgi:hypothetical protein
VNIFYNFDIDIHTIVLISSELYIHTSRRQSHVTRGQELDSISFPEPSLQDCVILAITEQSISGNPSMEEFPRFEILFGTRFNGMDSHEKTPPKTPEGQTESSGFNRLQQTQTHSLQL